MATTDTAVVERRLAARLTGLETVLGVAAERLDPHLASQAEALLSRAGERLLLSTEHTVVALAGATGSGKSSLFNALCGLELAKVGVRRPTTSEAFACVWGSDGAAALLDWLGIPRRHQVEHGSVLADADTVDMQLRGLVLLDLPDHDSTQLAHRLEAERLVELVDLLVWVVDPQKYADGALHERYLRPLATHSAVTRVVLNQADRLTPVELAACRGDLERLLELDGMREPDVLVVSARTGAGVDALRADLAEAVRGRATRVRRLDADLDRLVPALTAAVGSSPGEISGPDRRAVVNALSSAAGVPLIVSAVERSMRRRAVAATGWPFTRWLRGLRPDPLRRLGLGSAVAAARGVDGAEPAAGDAGPAPGVAPVSARRSSLPEMGPSTRAQVELALTRLSDDAAASLPVTWREAMRAAARGGQGDLVDALDRAMTQTSVIEERDPWWWRAASLLQWVLAAATVVGLGWLALLAVLGYFRLPEPATPYLGPLPWPTVLVFAGVAVGLSVAAGCRVLARIGARRRGRRAQRRLRRAVEEVAQVQVFDPVEEELQRWRSARAGLDAIRG